MFFLISKGGLLFPGQKWRRNQWGVGTKGIVTEDIGKGTGKKRRKGKLGKDVNRQINK